MQAVRYRLRFTVDVSLPGAEYGSGTYGTQTYGQSATDPVSSPRYLVLPWPGGYLSSPAWLYRQYDTVPEFRARVIDNEGNPLDFTSSLISLMLTPYGNGATWREYGLEEGSPPGVVFREWEPGDLDQAGTYRAVVVSKYASGRRLTIPADDRCTFVVTGA
jgi:hypothetical protein